MQYVGNFPLVDIFAVAVRFSRIFDGVHNVSRPVIGVQNPIGIVNNYQIPIKDIASKGNIKKSIDDYIADCKTLTKAGSKK